jgi:beta-xylosidase
MKDICYLLILLSFDYPALSQAWNPDNGDGTFKNPVIYADYSDPDVIREGESFYMISSSFNCVPGLPVLQSFDLVNWTIIAHVFEHQNPDTFFNRPQHGNGVWAPSIRYHNNEFYIYYGDPDFGIYMTKTSDIKGPWSEPVVVMEGKGLIDPCPFWDDDGNVYLVHAWAGSRSGIKSILTLNRMNSEGTKVKDKGLLIFDGHVKQPTIEGPKIYKRNGYYYILAPAGGVKNGWQLALRSKNIAGPYEDKIVLHQGNTSVNGPHQGAWVETQSGESWFLHFQDLDAYGRVVLLQPLQWIGDWPIIGVDSNNDSIGEPVMTYKKPNIQKEIVLQVPQCSDEFNSGNFGLQWQWQANSKINWISPSYQDFLRLNAIQIPDSESNLWDVPNLLLQKFAAPEFTTTAKLTFNARSNGEEAGILVMGTDYACLSLLYKNDTYNLVQNFCTNADKKSKPVNTEILRLGSGVVYLRIIVRKHAVCHFAYSIDGNNFYRLERTFIAGPGKWIGAKIGIYCIRTNKTNNFGFADFDWFRITKNDNSK